MEYNNPFEEQASTSHIAHNDYSWEQAYKKWFIFRFTLLLIALALALILSYVYFVKLPKYERIIDNQSLYVPSRIYSAEYATSTSSSQNASTTSSSTLRSH